MAHRPSLSTACGIFPDQGSNLCPLHWQADSQPLRHQGSPIITFNESNKELAQATPVPSLLQDNTSMKQNRQFLCRNIFKLLSSFYEDILKHGQYKLEIHLTGRTCAARCPSLHKEALGFSGCRASAQCSSNAFQKCQGPAEGST